MVWRAMPCIGGRCHMPSKRARCLASCPSSLDSVPRCSPSASTNPLPLTNRPSSPHFPFPLCCMSDSKHRPPHVPSKRPCRLPAPDSSTHRPLARLPSLPSPAPPPPQPVLSRACSQRNESSPSVLPGRPVRPALTPVGCARTTQAPERLRAGACATLGGPR